MGLLTVYQINLGVGPANYGAAGPTPAKSQPTPQRATLEFVTGRGFFVPEMSTTATEPFLGVAGSTPQYPYVLAADQTESQAINIGALAAGASTTVTTTVGFTLPAVSLDPTDNGTLLLVPDVWQNPVVSGLVIASIDLEPQALSPTNGWISARTIQGGQTYTNWRCQATIGLVAVTATAATTLHVGAQALLTILPQ